MSYAHNGNIRLYYETVGQGPPLLLHQGFATPIPVWELDGYLEEVRISDEWRSNDWLAATYNNQNDPGTFYNVGAEES